jgi:hypothetical protein
VRRAHHSPDLELAALLAERDLRHQQQVETLRSALDAMSQLTDAKLSGLRTLIDTQAEKVALALASADKAVSKAESATERRFEGVNEFRQTLSDQAREFVTRREFETLRTTGTERMDEMRQWLDRAMGEQTGGRRKVVDQRAQIAAIVGVAALVISLVVVAVNVLTSG